MLLDSPSLTRRPEPEAFAEHFSREKSVVAFSNLGGDAILVVPCQVVEPLAYAHLAAFVRLAPGTQRQALWQLVGEATTGALASSRSGLAPPAPRRGLAACAARRQAQVLWLRAIPATRLNRTSLKFSRGRSLTDVPLDIPIISFFGGCNAQASRNSAGSVSCCHPSGHPVRPGRGDNARLRPRMHSCEPIRPNSRLPARGFSRDCWLRCWKNEPKRAKPT